jgi:hypothetical protein
MRTPHRIGLSRTWLAFGLPVLVSGAIAAAGESPAPR